MVLTEADEHQCAAKWQQSGRISTNQHCSIITIITLLLFKAFYLDVKLKVQKIEKKLEPLSPQGNCTHREHCRSKLSQDVSMLTMQFVFVFSWIGFFAFWSSCCLFLASSDLFLSVFVVSPSSAFKPVVQFFAPIAIYIFKQTLSLCFWWHMLWHIRYKVLPIVKPLHHYGCYPFSLQNQSLVKKKVCHGADI